MNSVLKTSFTGRFILEKIWRHQFTIHHHQIRFKSLVRSRSSSGSGDASKQGVQISKDKEALNRWQRSLTGDHTDKICSDHDIKSRNSSQKSDSSKSNNSIGDGYHSIKMGDDKCKVNSLDHLVLTVEDLVKTITFYTTALGMSLVEFGEGRKALKFGTQKINLHQARKEFKPFAKKPMPGSADLCFVSEEPLQSWIGKLQKLGIEIEEGPVNRTGAVGPISSIYVRDPDGNLIEIANY